MKPSRQWKLKQGQATVTFETLRLTVDAAQPNLGGLVEVTPSATEDSQTAAALFQVTAVSQEVAEGRETYCRGADLITRYRATQQQPIVHETYWRLGAGDPDADQPATCLSIETVCSLETDLLNSSPQPSVPTSFFDATTSWFNAAATDQGLDWGECSWDEACATASEPRETVACVVHHASGISILQTVFPSDLRAIELSTMNQQTDIHWQLQSDFLEKGVIRRLRLLTVIGGQSASDQDLLAAAGEFYQSELPLTV